MGARIEKPHGKQLVLGVHFLQRPIISELSGFSLPPFSNIQDYQNRSLNICLIYHVLQYLCNIAQLFTFAWKAITVPPSDNHPHSLTVKFYLSLKKQLTKYLIYEIVLHIASSGRFSHSITCLLMTCYITNHFLKYTPSRLHYRGEVSKSYSSPHSHPERCQSE